MVSTLEDTAYLFSRRSKTARIDTVQMKWMVKEGFVEKEIEMWFCVMRIITVFGPGEQ